MIKVEAFCDMCDNKLNTNEVKSYSTFSYANWEPSNDILGETYGWAFKEKQLCKGCTKRVLEFIDKEAKKKNENV